MVKDIIEAPDLDGFRRDDPQRLVTAALSGISRYTLPESVRDDYLASYQGNRFAESVRYLRSYPAELPLLAGLLPQISTPVQIIAGVGDTTVPPVNARFLHERLPHSKLDVIDAGHFTWEDAAAEYAALITGWWRGAANGSRK
jgi:pimeloyl-ACP methyl ester carboxylesterase